MKSLQDRLIAFAQEDERIVALTKGNDPEDDVMTRSVVYYFITEGVYDGERSDKISDLCLAIAREGYDSCISEWPNVVLSDYPFLGEVIWKREEVN
ncbi:MAG: hypothetical protein RL557_972 [archaeon]|jgi:hypothetical protein